MKTIEELKQTLNQINWDFSDYNSSKYPLDINSVPWYPATFPAPIPKFLIALLSDVGDTVLDPFGGKGTTVVEAIKLNRRFVYNDLNPFAVCITDAIVRAIKSCSFERDALERISNSDKEIGSKLVRLCCKKNYSAESVMEYCPEHLLDNLRELDINTDVIFWYHIDTLLELYAIIKHMKAEEFIDNNAFLIRKLAFVSILKETSSQRGHFTYVTDNCRPKNLVYYNAISAYLSMLERINLSSLDLLKQYLTTSENGDISELIGKSIVHIGDARQLNWIDDDSIDFVLTSPPYLCAQDYVKTMRLTNLFFPDESFVKSVPNEIGSRSRRRSNAEIVVSNFYSDMETVFAEIERVLKSKKYFCLIIGQGKGKITKSYDTIGDLIKSITTKFEFSEVFRTNRRISHKIVRIGGVDTETIVVFQKK